MRKRAILYIRVSTDDQKDGYSPADQEERLIKFCQQNDIEIVRICHEDESAKDFENRPEWQKILSFIKKNKNAVDIILFAKWDRFSRNVAEAYITIKELRKYNIEAQAMEQPLDFAIPESKFMLAVYLAAPEVDNDRRALNTFNGMRRARKEGHWVTPPIIGYKRFKDEKGKPFMVLEGGKIEGFVRKSFTEFATGLHTIDTLRRRLNKEGFKISRTSFNDLLKNKAYIGQIFIPAYKDEPPIWINAVHEALIDETIFYEVQDILNGRKKMPSKYITLRDELPLRGFITCPKCGKNLTGSASKGRNGKFFYYHCNRGCQERKKATELNGMLSTLFKSLSFNKEGINLLGEILKQEMKADSKTNKTEVLRLNSEIEKHQLRLKNARTLMLDGDFSALEYREMKAEIEEQIKRLELQRAKFSSDDENLTEQIDFCVALLSNIEYCYDVADIETKQQIIGSIFPEKLVFDNKKCRTAKLEDSVELLCLNSKGFKGSKKEKHPIYEMLSVDVHMKGLEPPPLRTRS